jgi:putative component of membrane protein insertase Oxa1/YidC/SpoIIIJ protein YidD
LTILFLSISYHTFAQSKQDILQYQKIFETKKESDRYAFAKKDINNEVDLLFSGLYLGYKLFLSSQDLSPCVFYPSCSTFALQSIKKHGVFMGSLGAFDRLTRCNGFSTKNYQIYAGTHLLYDPVE